MVDASKPFDRAAVDRLLSTTRSVRRRLELDRPVDLAVVHECLGLALQAPTGSNNRSWRFLVVTDPATRAALASIYRKGLAVHAEALGEMSERGMDLPLTSDEGRLRTLDAQTKRSMRSAAFLTAHLHEVPVLVVPCLLGRLAPQASVFMQAAYWGSIHPAIWSFQLALRSRGYGSVYTTLHLAHEAEAAEVLGIPSEVTQCGLVPVAATTGEFHPAWREPVAELTFADRWGEPFEVSA
jgi:nitroreductase